MAFCLSFSRNFIGYFKLKLTLKSVPLSLAEKKMRFAEK